MKTQQPARMNAFAASEVTSDDKDIGKLLKKHAKSTVDMDVIKAVSEQQNFPSREAPARHKSTEKKKRVKVVRSHQLNVRVSEEYSEKFEEICEHLGVMKQVAMERIIEAYYLQLENA